MAARRKIDDSSLEDRVRATPRLADDRNMATASPARQLQERLATTAFADAGFDSLGFEPVERWSARTRVAIMVGTASMLWGTIFLAGSAILH